MVSTCPICESIQTSPWLSAPDRFHSRNRTYPLQRCGICSYIWQLEPPAREDMGNHYSHGYHRTITRAGENTAGRWETHRNQILKYKQAGAILDIGCSSGAFLKRFCDGSWKLFGIEMSRAEANRAHAETGADVQVGYAVDVVFDSNSFDVITAFDLLEHVYSPREVVRRVYKWLKPNGIFYMLSPNALCWEAMLFRSYWYGLELPRHVSHFSPQSLRRLMASAGFVEEIVTTPRLTHAERSMRYVFDRMLASVGFHRGSMADLEPPTNVSWRILRRGFRMTALAAFSRAAAAASAGPALQAVFRKPSARAYSRGSSARQSYGHSNASDSRPPMSTVSGCIGLPRCC